MSTKDISRSAIEGGRNNGNKWDRNQSHRAERARAKVWLDKVRFDEEFAEEASPVPRNKVPKGFTDKLNPCYSWLASHAGQPWDTVRSKLTKTFDTRLLSAWHIVNQHMLPEVEGAGTTSDALGRYKLQRFFIDDDGLLRDRGERRRLPKEPTPSDLVRVQVVARLAGRRIMGYGKLHWGNPSTGLWEACPKYKVWCRHKTAEHRTKDVTPQNVILMYTEGTHRTWKDSPHWRKYEILHLAPNWSMGKRLTKAEEAWWDTVPRWMQVEYQYSTLFQTYYR